MGAVGAVLQVVTGFEDGPSEAAGTPSIPHHSCELLGFCKLLGECGFGQLCAPCTFGEHRTFGALLPSKQEWQKNHVEQPGPHDQDGTYKNALWVLASRKRPLVKPNRPEGDISCKARSQLKASQCTATSLRHFTLQLDSRVGHGIISQSCSPSFSRRFPPRCTCTRYLPG